MNKQHWLSRALSYVTKERRHRFLDEKQLFKNAPLFYKVLAVFVGFVIVGVTFVTFINTNNIITVKVPTSGGSLHEGIVGIPRYINPILTVSSADKDLVDLVFAGLMKKTSNGELEAELAQSYTISEDGTTYTFNLRDEIYFHDGSRVTASDVAFTIKQLQDPAINSPLRGNWTGVRTEIINPTQVRFILSEPYAPFINNTTLGILPKHIWENTNAEQFALSTYNIEAIGAGPFKIQDIKRKGGVPDVIHLIPNTHYPLGTPYIQDILLYVYPDELSLIDGFNQDKIQSAPSISQSNLSLLNLSEKNNHKIISLPLPRVFYLYLNQNKADIFTDDTLRVAVDQAIDQQALVDQVFQNHASVLEGPLPPNPFISNAPAPIPTKTASKILDEAGWTVTASSSSSGIRTDEDGNELAFTLSTSNNPELKRTAQIIKNQLANVGVRVDINFYDTLDLNQNIIRPREFQSLLFGAIVNDGFDLYPLWHSSQRIDPGLNISQYTNIDVDAYLERARATTTSKVRFEALEKASEEIQKDLPVIPLYTPHFIYIQSPHIKNNEITYISEPHDRFADIHKWYIETRGIWLPFVQENTFIIE